VTYFFRSKLEVITGLKTNIVNPSSFMQIPLTLLDQGVVNGTNFLIGLILARALGPEKFGMFTFGIMVTWLLLGIDNAAVFSPMLSIGPRQPSDERPAYLAVVVSHHSIVVIGFAAICMLGAALAGMVYPQHGYENLLFCATLASVARVSQDFMRRHFYATSRPLLALENSIVGCGLQLCAILASLTVWPLSVPEIFLALTGASVVSVVASSLRFGSIDFRAKIFLEATARHWKMAKWLLASALANWCCTNTFYLATGAMLGPAALGELHAAFQITAAVNIIALGLENYLPVRLSRLLDHEGLRVAQRTGLIIMIGCVAAATLMTVVISVNPAFWFRLLYGDKYSSYSLVYAFAVHMLLVIVFVILSAGLRVLEHSRVIFLSWLVMAVFTFVIVVPMIKLVGLPGAAWGIAMTQLLGTSFTAWKLRQLLRALRMKLQE